MALLESAPYLLPLQSTDECIYSGFVYILNQSYRLDVHVPRVGGLSRAELSVEWRLKRWITDKLTLIEQRLKGAVSLSSFVKDFVTICESCLKNNANVGVTWTEHTRCILNQIQAVGWERVLNLSSDFSKVVIGCYDSHGRQHKLTLSFNRQDPLDRPVCITVLPQKFDFHWSPKSQICDVVKQFEASLESYQKFWSLVGEIDQNTWVMEPEKPSFACTHRRIALGRHTSLHITINPMQPTSLPECRLLGPQSAVGELREKLNVNLHRWELDRSLLYNLQDILEVDFPTYTDTTKEDLCVSCGICYSHHLGDDIPDIVCEHQKCSQAFHHVCLYEWLRNSACRQSFNYVFGECPFCTHLEVKTKLGENEMRILRLLQYSMRQCKCNKNEVAQWKYYLLQC